MASALYTKFKEFMLGATAPDLGNAATNVKVVCVDAADYTLAIATDQFLSDITGAGRVATSGNLTTKAITGGVFDADDITINTVTGDQFEYLVIYIDTGVAGTSRLIAIFDTATGLPFTPSGGNITIAWDNGTNKIFKL
jgi:hypothetical protein